MCACPHVYRFNVEEDSLVIDLRGCSRRRVWVHDILRGREQHGEYHRLVQELQLDGERFKCYFRLGIDQFGSLLSNWTADHHAAHKLPLPYTSHRGPGNLPPLHVGVSTVAKIVNQVTRAIWHVLVPEFMPVPTTEDWRSIAEGFQHRWGFPNRLGSIDGKHVVIRAPGNSRSLFYNYKGTYSIVPLAVVDVEYCFRVVAVGGYGRTSDGGVLANSTFGRVTAGWDPWPATGFSTAGS
ncbi:hypothetical protein ABVT39_024408 [Epinephelus coioides]